MRKVDVRKDMTASEVVKKVLKETIPSAHNFGAARSHSTTDLGVELKVVKFKDVVLGKDYTFTTTKKLFEGLQKQFPKSSVAVKRGFWDMAVKPTKQDNPSVPYVYEITVRYTEKPNRWTSIKRKR